MLKKVLIVLDQACWFDFICKDRTSGALLARQVLLRTALQRLKSNSYTFRTNKGKLGYIAALKNKLTEWRLPRIKPAFSYNKLKICDLKREKEREK